MVTQSIAIKALFIVSFLTCLVALFLMRRDYAGIARENDLLKRKLRSAKRKVEQWKRGWGPEKQHILEALSDAFLLVNGQGKIMFANERSEYLFQSSELEGTFVRDYIGNEALLREIQKALDAPGIYTAEFYLLAGSSPDPDHQDAETFWFIDSAPVAGTDGYRRILIRDVTLQHRTEQVRKDFVANASHELRTPMTIILGYLETLREEGFIAESPETAEKFMSTMFKHGKRVQRIVEDMLMISKLESGDEAALKEAPFDLRACVTDVFTRLESIADKNGAHLALDFKPADITLFGDQFYWTQILFNLVENALKQNMEPGLDVTVGARIEASRVRVWVSDNGIGIPAAHLPYIFKRFYRVELPSQQEIKGTGLGLSIVKRAVEAHQGSLDVASTPGRETRFTIILPLSRLSPERERAAIPEEAAPEKQRS